MPGILHTRLNELIEFARQTATMRDVPVSDVDTYATRYFVAHQRDLEKLPGVSLNIGDSESGDETWFSIARLRELPSPVPESELLNLWISVSNDPNKVPTLKTGIENAGKGLRSEQTLPTQFTELKEFSSRERVESEFAEYLENKWKPWFVNEAPRRRTILLYGKLFALKQLLEGSIVDSPIELIWGVGVAKWNAETNRVNFPLITKAVELSLNDETMAIEISPRDVEARIELGIYNGMGNPSVAAVQKAATEHFDSLENTFSPFEESSFCPLLRVAATLLQVEGCYLPDLAGDDEREQAKLKSTVLRVSDEWVIFARPRGSNIFVNDLEAFQKRLREADTEFELPEAIRTIVEEPSGLNTELELPEFRGLSMIQGSGDGSGSKSPKELFFPLPFNDEQVRIVQLLEVSNGVVVQGPPGTGKTHTIANIICHYLAQGKRVLVTSMREPALTVLKEKLPKELQSLVVSLLTNEKAGLKQFEYAIERIAYLIQSVFPDRLRKDIKQAEDDIENLHSTIAGYDRDISDWAERNLSAIALDDELVNPVDAAREVITYSNTPEWFVDRLTVSANNRPLFSRDDLSALRSARRHVGADLGYINRTLPRLDELPESSAVIEAHRSLSKFSELQSQVASGSFPDLVANSPEVFKTVQKTVADLSEYRRAKRSLEQSNEEWISKMISRLRNKTSDELVTLLCKLGAELEANAAKQRDSLERPISLPSGFDSDSELIAAVERLAIGEKPFGLKGLFGKSSEKRKLEEVRILASNPRGSDDWSFVLDHLNLRSGACQGK